jgi:hypothetical protein
MKRHCLPLWLSRNAAGSQQGPQYPHGNPTLKVPSYSQIVTWLGHSPVTLEEKRQGRNVNNGCKECILRCFEASRSSSPTLSAHKIQYPILNPSQQSWLPLVTHSIRKSLRIPVSKESPVWVFYPPPPPSHIFPSPSILPHLHSSPSSSLR